MIRLHNTLTRSVEDFTPQNSQLVTLYSCGPTVYDNLTVGNWSAYIRWDILARVIRKNYNLKWYMNITDVGHLVSDSDEGEDKLEKSAKRDGTTAWEVAKKYTDDFLSGLNNLNISVEQDNLVKATDHISEQINLVKLLEEKGHTYLIDDGVYFDSTTFKDYGKMARLDLAGLQAGARVDVGQKKHSTDFAVWKLTPLNQRRDMEWDSPWGRGFPGWHIECSAMAMKYLGETIDIHTGGIDHIPVHHTNEIAQSETATGKTFVKYWLHCNFIKVDGVKISKSLGNGYTLEDVTNKGFSYEDFRFLILQSHYRTESNFTWEALSAAHDRLNELNAFAVMRFQTTETDAFDYNNITVQITADLMNDLNTPMALSRISPAVDHISRYGLSHEDRQQFEVLLQTLDDLLGLGFMNLQEIDSESKQLIIQRQKARDSKDWDAADKIRDQLAGLGIGIDDTASGTRWYWN